MKRHIGKLLVLALAVLSLATSALPVLATEDKPEKGSLTAVMQYDGKAVPGGTLALYLVADADVSTRTYAYRPAYTQAGEAPASDEALTADLAEKLAGYAAKTDADQTATADASGKVRFSNLDPGLYLVTQTKAASGYEKISPFLASVPSMPDFKTFVYDVDATVKMELLKKAPEAPAPVVTPEAPKASKLPQTGQLWWPVPVLACAGAVLVAAGVRRRHLPA